MEVAHDHTFTVGAGQWIVHNCSSADEVVAKLEAAGVKTDKANHFRLRLSERGANVNADDIQNLLVDGSPFYDTRDANFGVKGVINNKTYAVLFDGDGTVMGFLSKNEISKRRGRYLPVLKADLPYSWEWLRDITFT